MSKKLFVLGLSFALVLSLTGCFSGGKTPKNVTAEEEPCNICENETVVKITNAPVFDVRQGIYHVTSAVLIQDGVAKALTRHEYRELLNSDLYSAAEPVFDRSKPEAAINMDTAKPHKSKLLVSKPYYAEAHMYRPGNWYKGAGMVGVSGDKDDPDFERILLGDGGLDVTASMQKKIDKEIQRQCRLLKSGYALSAHSAIEFTPNSAHPYATVAFVPRVVDVAAKLHFVEDSYLSQFDMTYQYPYISETGLMDGLYLLIGVDTEEETLELEFE